MSETKACKGAKTVDAKELTRWSSSDLQREVRQRLKVRGGRANSDSRISGLAEA
jgi:hypothetical protein